MRHCLREPGGEIDIDGIPPIPSSHGQPLRTRVFTPTHTHATHEDCTHAHIKPTSALRRHISHLCVAVVKSPKPTDMQTGALQPMIRTH
mmetsp:Transcript_8802/g.25328  ORF Transcript_8802/g.25328 Transcript_8802/m.25328 type:complete len:89 (+) Transcript_8802:1850-2116(+)